MELGSWDLTEEFVQDYLGAVGDELPLYSRHGLVPPVALAARALGSLLERLELSPGAIHSLQEISTLAPVAVGERMTGTAEVGRPKRRAGMEFITAAVSLRNQTGEDVLNSKSTVLVLDSPSSASSKSRDAGNPTESGLDASKQIKRSYSNDPDAPTALPVISRTITQDRLVAYANVSGDHNPLHLDPQFAATTQFGGIIAHGMLTLAFVSEMMATEFQKPWLESGALRVRFKGAAYLGDSVKTSGRLEKAEARQGGQQLTCGVGVSSVDGREIISGSATLLK